jgi:hypothetical protein
MRQNGQAGVEAFSLVCTFLARFVCFRRFFTTVSTKENQRRQRKRRRRRKSRRRSRGRKRWKGREHCRRCGTSLCLQHSFRSQVLNCQVRNFISGRI